MPSTPASIGTERDGCEPEAHPAPKQRQANLSPVAAVNTPEIAASQRPTTEVVCSPYRVLLVEDNPTNQRLMRRLLEAMHCLVDVAANGREAVDRVASSRYEAVFMDCHMPVMDGYDASVQIRQTEPAERLPIIAVTASIVPEDHRRCHQSGMNQVITKPVEPEEIRRALSRWCRRAGTDAGAGAGDSAPCRAA